MNNEEKQESVWSKAIPFKEQVAIFKRLMGFVKHFKFEFEKSYSATPEEQIMSSFNTMCDEVIKVLRDKALDEEIKHHD